MQKEKIKYCIVKKRVKKELKKDNLFYYDLRHYDNNVNKYVIERDNVIVNFYGTMITDKEILKGREFIDYKDFYKNNNLIKYKTLNPFRKITN